MPGPNSRPPSPYASLPAFDPETRDLNVMIETPSQSRNKYKYDEAQGVFKLSGVLPVGMVFPFDFGYIPATVGEDGDPLDVLLLLESPVVLACLVPARLVGVIEAEQTERDGKTERNDRLLAVACKSHDYRDIEDMSQLSESLIEQIESFFVSYNALAGKRFAPLGRKGAAAAKRLVAAGQRRHKKESAK